MCSRCFDVILVLELDMEGTISPDEDLSQEMGDSSLEVTEEMRDKAQEEKMQGSIALSDGKYSPFPPLWPTIIHPNSATT